MKRAKALLRRACDVVVRRYSAPLLQQLVESLEPRWMLNAPHIVAASFNAESSPHTIVVQFDQDVSASLSTSDLVVMQDTTDTRITSTHFLLSYDVGSNTATFSRRIGSLFANGNYHVDIAASSVTNPAGEPLQSGLDFHFFYLAGDVNQDRVVDSADLAIVNGHLNQSGTFSQGDEDYSGTVDSDDLADIQDMQGRSLPADPSAPIGLTVTQSTSTTRQVSWVDSSTGPVSYRIQRSTDGASFTTAADVAANTTEYTDSGLDANTSYFYRIRAFGNAVDSDYSDAVVTNTPLATPTGLTTSSVGAHSLQLSWTDNTSGESGYEVQVSRNGGAYVFYATLPANATSTLISGLGAATSYAFRVRAISTSAVSAYSDPATVVTPAGTPIVLDPEFNYQTSPQSLGFLFDQDVSEGISKDDLNLANLLTGQQFNSSSLSLSASDTTETFGDLPTDVLSSGNYEAILDGGIHNVQGSLGSDYSYPFFFLAGDVNHDRVVDSKDVAIVESNFGTTIATFDRGDADYDGVVGATDVNLVGGNYYGVRLPAPPTAPNTLIASAATDDPSHKIALNWTAPETDPVDGFRIWRSTDGVNFTQVAEIANPDARNWIDTGLDEGGKYTYRVRAYTNAAGDSVSTNKAWAGTVLIAPSMPTIAANSLTSVTVSWNGKSVPAGYVIERATGDGDFDESWDVGSNTSKTFTDLVVGTNYRFRVHAYRSDTGAISGNSPEAITAAAQMLAANFNYEQNPHKLTFQFDQDVSASLSVDDLQVQQVGSDTSIPSSDFSLSYDNSTNMARFTYTPGIFDDGNYRAVLLAKDVTNVQGKPLANDVAYDFFFLTGDGNHDRTSNSQDRVIVNHHLNQPGTYSQGDYNYDGMVTGDDRDYVAVSTSVLFAPSQAPSGLTVIPTASGNELGWAMQLGLGGTIRIQRSTDGHNYTTLDDVSANSVSYLDTTAQSGTTYLYRVAVINASASSPYSLPQSSDDSFITAPNGVSVSNIAAHSATIAWNDNSSDEGGFEIWESKDGGDYQFAASVAPNSASLKLGNLISESSYKFEIRAIGSADVSAFSIPSSPIATSYAGVNITSSSFDPETAPQKLQFTFDQDVSGSLTTSKQSLTNLTTGAQLTAADSSLSYDTDTNTATFTFPDQIGFSYPNLAGVLPDGNYESIVDGSVHSFYGATLGDDYSTQFHILSGDLNRDRVVDDTDVQLFINDLSTMVGPGTFSQGDLNLDGYVNGSDINAFNAHYGVRLPPPPTGPNQLTATAATSDPAHQITVNWTPPADGSVDGFRVWRSTDGINFTQVAQIADPTARSWTDTDLDDGTKYTYRVRGYTNAAGNSATTNKAWSVTVLPAPTNLAGPATAAGTIHLTWTDNSVNESGFVIEQYNSYGQISYTYTVPANTTSYNVTGLGEGQAIQFQIHAYNNASAISATTQPITVTTLANPPAALSASPIGSSKVLLSWDDNSGKESGFVVQREVNQGTWAQISAPSANITSFVDSTAQTGVKYAYRVASTDDGGTSTFSTQAQSVSLGAVVGLTATNQTFDDQTAAHKLSFTFNEDISHSGLSTSDLLLTNLSTGQQILPSQMSLTFSVDGETAIFTFPGVVASGLPNNQDFPAGVLPQGNYEAILNHTPLGIAADVTFQFYFLDADANHDRVVNLIDLNPVATNFGNTENFSGGDYNYDGIVNIADFYALTDHFGSPYPDGPNPPTDLVVVPNTQSTANILRWNVASGVDGYRIFRSTDGIDYAQVKQLDGASTNTWTDTNISVQDTQYTYLVRSFNSAGDSRATNKAGYTTPQDATNSSNTLVISGASTAFEGDLLNYSVTGPGAGQAVWTITRQLVGASAYNTFATGSGSHFQFTPDKAGDYVVEVAAINGTTTLSDSMHIPVLPAGPKVTILGQKIAYYGRTASLTAHMDGIQANDPNVKYFWQILDTSGNTLFGADPGDSSADPQYTSATCIFPSLDIRKYTIKVTILTSDGARSTALRGLSVVDDPADESYERALVPTPGGGGWLGHQFTTAEVVEQQGMIVVAGEYLQDGVNSQLYIARFKRDFTLDTSFGPSHSGVTLFSFTNGERVRIQATAIDPVTQDIVVAGDTEYGWTDVSSSSPQNDALNVLRFTKDGSVDTTFNGGTTFSIREPDRRLHATSVVVLSDESILVGRLDQDIYTPPVEDEPVLMNRRHDNSLLIKLTPAGKLDKQFGKAGLAAPATYTMVDPDFNNGAASTVSIAGRASSITVLNGGTPNEKYLISGYGYYWPNGVKAIPDEENPGRYFLLMRYNADGSLDSSFGTNGHVLLSGQEQLGTIGAYTIAPDFRAINVEADGSLFAIGAESDGSYSWNIVFAHFSAQGVPDNTFGNGGLEKTDLVVSALHGPDPTSPIGIEDVIASYGGFVFLPNGTIVASVMNPDSVAFALIGLDRSGHFEDIHSATPFGAAGDGKVVLSPFGTDGDSIYGPGQMPSAWQGSIINTADGIVAVGNVWGYPSYPESPEPLVVRYHPDLPEVKDLAATGVGEHNIHITWTDGDQDAGYEIQRSTTGNPDSYVTIGLTDDAGSSYLDQDHSLIPGQTYYYQVYALDQYGLAGSATTSASTWPDLSGYGLIESVVVPPDGTLVKSQTQLLSGVKYLVRVSGHMFAMGSDGKPLEIDPEYQIEDSQAQDTPITASGPVDVGIAINGSGQVQFAHDGYRIDESANTATFTVVRTGGLVGNLAFKYNTVDGTATSGGLNPDYTSISGTVTLAQGVSTYTISVPVIDDSEVENDETFSIKLKALNDTEIGSTTATIIDNDNAADFRLSASDLQIKAGQSIPITVERTGRSNGTATVHLLAVDGTAISTTGGDYSPIDLTHTFKDGEMSWTTSITAASISRGYERQFTVNLEAENTVASPAAVIAPGIATVTISDAGIADPESFAFDTSTYAASEGDGEVALKVVRTAGSNTSVAVAYTINEGSAKYNADFGGDLTDSVTFGPGETSKTIDIPLIDDAIPEIDENFTVALTSASYVGSTDTSPGIVAPSTATVTIHDDDAANLVQFSSPAYSVSESAVWVNVTIIRTGDASNVATVRYETFDGSATQPADYTHDSQSLTFTPGETSKTIQIPIISDSTPELTETFDIRLRDAQGFDLGSLAASTISIIDDDNLASPAFQLATSTESVSEGGGQALLTVVRTGSSSQAVSVNYATSAGTATAGLDYTSESGTLNFAAGEVSKTITIPILQDQIAEGREAFDVNLSSPSSGTSLGSPSSATLTIVDDETPAILQFASPAYAVSEAENSIFLTVQRSGDTNASVTIDYATLSDLNAFAGVDYTATSGTLTFSAGELSKTIQIPILPHSGLSADTAFDVTLSNPSSAATIGANSDATIDIKDEDNNPNQVQLGFHQAADTVTEGSAIKVEIDRTGSNLNQWSSVQWETSPGTAQPLLDYGRGDGLTALKGTVEFAPNQSVAIIWIPTQADTLFEKSETFFVKLKSPAAINGSSAEVALGAHAETTVTIQDQPNHFSLSRIPVTNIPSNLKVISSTAYEWHFGPGFIFPVSADMILTRNAGNSTVSVPWIAEWSTSSDGANGKIYASGSVTIEGNLSEQTFSLPAPPIDSYATSISKTIYVTVRLADGTSGELAASVSPFVVIPQFVGYESNPGNNQAQPQLGALISDSTVGLGQAVYLVNEGAGSAQITVTRSGDTADGTLVDYATTTEVGDSATANVDYSAVTGTVSFAANETSETFSIPILTDVPGTNDAEPNERFTVTLSNLRNLDGGSSSAVLNTTPAKVIIASLADAQKQPAWGPPNAEHTYQQIVTGDSNPLYLNYRTGEYTINTDTSTTGYQPFVVQIYAPLPEIPTQLTAKADWLSQSIKLTWNETDDAKQYYRIERSVDGGDFTTLTTVAPGVTSFIDSTGDSNRRVDPNTRYAYRIFSHAVAGESKASNQAYAILVDHAPVITLIPTQMVLPGKPFGYAVQATDAESGSNLTYTIESVSDGQSPAIDPHTGYISGLTLNNDGDTCHITVKVTEPEVNGTALFASQTFWVIAQAPIVPPPSITAKNYQSVPTDPSIGQLTATVNNPDNTVTDNYLWTVIGLPAGATQPLIEHADQLTTNVTFSKAGTYRFRLSVQASNAPGVAVTGDVVAAVDQISSHITIMPIDSIDMSLSTVVPPNKFVDGAAQIAVAQSGTQAFLGVAYDQFNDLMIDADGEPSVRFPDFNWALLSGNSSLIGENKGYAVEFDVPNGTNADVYVLKAALGTTSVAGEADITVSAFTGPDFTMAPLSTDHTYIDLSPTITFGDSSNPSYAWSVLSIPPNAAIPTFSNPTAQNTRINFSASSVVGGNSTPYILKLTVTDSHGVRKIGTVAVTVTPTATSLSVLPANPTVTISSTTPTVRLTAKVEDQFGQDMPTQPTTITWAIQGSSRYPFDQQNANSIWYSADPAAIPSQDQAIVDTVLATDPATGFSATVPIRVGNKQPIGVSLAVNTDSGIVDHPQNIDAIIDDPANEKITSYVLSAIPAGQSKGVFVLQGSGTLGSAPGEYQRIGALDPTQLPDGIYMLMLTATADDGRTSFATQQVQIRANVKLGNLTLPFTDLNVPVPGGAPISVSRTYDSQYASEDTGLGYGWRLDSNVPAVKTTSQNHYSSEKTTSLAYGDLIYITLPGGQQQVFAFTPKDNTTSNPLSGFIGDVTTYEPAFTAVDGGNSVLTVQTTGYSDSLIKSGGVYYGDTLSGKVGYNPALPVFGGQYTLTTADGTVYSIDATNATKVESAVNVAGNSLTYTDSSITSTAQYQASATMDGSSVAWFSSPDGRRIDYSYDTSNGNRDLIGVIERGTDFSVTSKTSFVYDDHLLLSYAGLASDSFYALVSYGTNPPINVPLTAINDRPQHLNDDPPNTTAQWYTAPIPSEIIPGTVLTITYHKVSAGTDTTINSETRTFGGLAHHLIAIVDNRGVRVLTAAYDSTTGQLTQLSDIRGSGAKMSNGYTGDNAQQQVASTDGNSVRYEYNDQGDPIKEIHTVKDGTGAITGYSIIIRDIQYTSSSFSFEDNIPQANVLMSYNESSPFFVSKSRSADIEMSVDQLAAAYMPHKDGKPLWATMQGYYWDKPVTDPDSRQLSSSSTLTASGDYLATQYSNYILGKPQNIDEPNGKYTHDTYDANTGLLTHHVVGISSGVQEDIYYDYTTIADGVRAGMLKDSYRLAANGTTKVYITSNTYYPDDSTSADLVRNMLKSTTDDLTGITTHYTYDSNGRMTEVRESWTDAAGNHDVRKSLTVYDAAGRVFQTFDANGLVSETHYDASGKTVDTKDRFAGWTHTDYDVTGNVIRTVYPDGTEVRTTYDAQGHVQWQTDRYYTGVTSTGPGSTPLIDNSTKAPRATLTTYDALGRAVATKQYADVLIQLQADPSAGVAGIDKSLIASYNQQLSVNSSVYDSLGRVVETDNPDGLRSGTIYYGNGQVKDQGTLAANAPADWFTKSTPLNYFTSFTSYQYDQPSGDLSYDTVTDALGHTTTTYKDGAGRIVQTQYDDGSTTRTDYSDVTATGYTTTDTDQLGRQTERDYDALGRLTDVWLPAVVDNDPNSATYTDSVRPHWHYTYDAHGDELTQVDPKGHVTSFTYDEQGRRISRTLPLGQRESSFYDDTQLGSITGTLSASVGMGELAFSVDFEGRITKYLYDNTAVGAGRLVSKTIYTGVTLTITDSTSISAIRSAISGVSPAETTSNHFDTMGRRDTVTDSLSGTWTYGYDAFGNQTSVTRTVGNTAVSSIHYEYDDQDRLKRTYTNKTDTRYTYDQFGRLSTVTAVLLNGAAVADSAAQDVSWYGQTIHGDNTTYYYDPIGNLDAQKNPGGSTTDYQYDQDNRLTEVDQFVDTNNNQTLDNGETVLGKFVYTLNDDGSRSQVDETDDQGNTRTTNWFYDADNRLIAEAMDVGGAASTAEDYITEYTYDLVGNRMSKITDNTLPDISTFVQNSTGTDSLTSDDTVTYSYDNNDRLLTETDNATGTTNDTTTVYGYGTDGESTGETSKMVYQGLTSSGTILSQTTYSYDAQGRMSQVQIDGNGGGAFETTTSYKYDDEGIRVEQTVTDNTGTKTYTYTIDSNNLTDYAQVLEEYVNNVLNKSYVIGTDVIAQTAPNDGTTLPSGTTAGQLLTLMYDGHGSTRALLNGLTVIQRFVYDAYGNQLSGVTLTSAVMALTNLLYSGEQFDAKIAMQYLRGRFYDPSTDRFGSFDTFENDPTSPFSLHKYLYANADPVDNDDPTGHFTSLNGLSAQAQITRIYIADHPGDKIVAGGVWSWLSNLKPDIQDYTTHEWLEVKPLTPTGLSDAVDAIFKYAPAAIFGWLPDHLWSPSTKTIWVNGQPEAIFNAGGIVFYGDQVELTAETVLGISLLTARTVAEYLPRIYELVGAGQRAIQLALGPGLDSDLGIATLNGELGAI